MRIQNTANEYWIRHILRQCWGFVTFWCGSGSPDPYLWLMDPDPTPNPTPFFSDFKDANKIISFHIFSYNLISVRSIYLWEKGRFRSQIRTCPDPGDPKTSGSPTLLYVKLTGYDVSGAVRWTPAWRRPYKKQCQNSTDCSTSYIFVGWTTSDLFQLWMML